MLSEILKLHINNAVKEAVKPLQEELLKIKKLNAAILKEGRQPAPTQEQGQKTRLLGKATGYSDSEVLNESYGHPAIDSSKDMYSQIKVAGASHFAKSGELPDIDIPVPSFMLK